MTPYTAIAIICANIVNRSTNQSFGTAVLAMQAGCMVRRQSWNGDFFVFRQVPSKVPHDVIPKMTSLPAKVKEVLMTRHRDLHYHHQFAVVDSLSNIQSFIPTVDDMEAHDWITEPAFISMEAYQNDNKIEIPTARETVGTAIPLE